MKWYGTTCYHLQSWRSRPPGKRTRSRPCRYVQVGDAGRFSTHPQRCAWDMDPGLKNGRHRRCPVTTQLYYGIAHCNFSIKILLANIYCKTVFCQFFLSTTKILKQFPCFQHENVSHNQHHPSFQYIRILKLCRRQINCFRWKICGLFERAFCKSQI